MMDLQNFHGFWREKHEFGKISLILKKIHKFEKSHDYKKIMKLEKVHRVWKKVRKF